MPDNVTTQSAAPATPPAATVIATVEASFSGDTVQAGVGVLAKSSGSEGSRSLTLINPATEDKQDTGNTSLASIDAKLTNPLPVSGTVTTGGLTDTQLRASAVPVSAASLPLPSGAATSAKQDTGNTSLASIDAKLTNPLPVSGTVAVTGGATAANQATEIASLASIDSKITAVNTGAVVVSSSALPTGAATLAEQQTQTASLSVLDDWDESDRAKVNPIVGQAGVAGNTGLVGATTQRVTLATDVALPTGTNSIGQVTANAGTNLNTSALALESGGNLAAIAASASVLDDWDESDRAKVNPIAGQAGVQGASGVVTALTQRVVLATDVALPAGNNNIGDVDVASVTGNVTVVQPTGTNLHVVTDSGTITTVSTVTAVTAITNALPAGTNAIGKLAANNGVDIGDVDVTSVPADPFGANADAASATGSISAKLRFIAGTGIPITGTVTVGSHAVTNAGTFAVQESGTQVQVDDAAFTPAVSKIVMAGFEADEGSTDSVDEGDGGAARMTLDRKVIVTPQPHTAGGLSTFMASNADGSTALVATAQAIKASAGQVYGWFIYNPNTVPIYVQFYNVAQASVTVGTTNPQMMLVIPALGAANVMGANGITFTNAGFSIAATTTAGGNTAPSTGLDANIFYA